MQASDAQVEIKPQTVTQVDSSEPVLQRCPAVLRAAVDRLRHLSERPWCQLPASDMSEALLNACLIAVISWWVADGSLGPAQSGEPCWPKQLAFILMSVYNTLTKDMQPEPTYAQDLIPYALASMLYVIAVHTDFSDELWVSDYVDIITSRTFSCGVSLNKRDVMSQFRVLIEHIAASFNAEGEPERR